jgi:hypothetical protein
MSVDVLAEATSAVADGFFLGGRGSSRATQQ